MTSVRVTVIGADDELGEAVVREALVRGISVTATAADPTRIARITAGLRIVGTDPRSPEALRDAVDGSDAVILGAAPALGTEATMARTETTIAVVRALRAIGSSRLVAASHVALGGPSILPGRLRRALAPVGRRRERGDLADLRRMEVLLESSGLATTVLRAPRLVDLLGSKAYRLLPPEDAGRAPLPREDLARALVDQSLEKASARAVYAVVPADPA